MKKDNLNKLLLEELKDTYNAEQQILKELPKVVKKANSEKLKEALEKHYDQTEKQVKKLGKVFRMLGEEPKGKKCLGMKGIIEENEESLQGEIDPSVKDATIIAGAQKIEHYEICCYGTMAAHAKSLGMDDAASILKEILDEEKHTDEELTALAESEINIEAVRM